MCSSGEDTYTLDGMHHVMQTGGEVLEYYKKTAKKYDQYCASHGKDVGAMSVANIIKKQRPSQDSRILDVGAGTGILGEKLKELGYREIDALDPVQEMLDEAKSKGIYKRYICEAIDASKASQIHENTYDVVCCIGAFLAGHMTPACLPELIRVAKPGGLVIFTIINSENYWAGTDDPVFSEDNVKTTLQSFVGNSYCTQWTQEEITYMYFSSNAKKARVYIITKS